MAALDQGTLFVCFLSANRRIQQYEGICSMRSGKSSWSSPGLLWPGAKSQPETLSLTTI
jgi:hypothetical protein